MHLTTEAAQLTVRNITSLESVMKSIRFTLFTLTVLMAGSAAAHDPALHAAEKVNAQAKPDCEAVDRMDHSKMDSKDPVAMAIHKKCAAERGKSDKADPQAAPTHPAAPSVPTTHSEHGGH